MKKLLSAVLAVIIVSVTLTGCNNDSGTSSSTDQSLNTSTSNADSTSPEDNTSTDSSSSEEDSGVIQPLPGEDDPDDESYPSVLERLEFPDTRAGKIAKTALSTYEDMWSGMLILPTDPEEIKIFFYNFDLSLCEDSCLITDMTGISGQELILAKAKSGKEDELKAWFDSYFEYLHSPDNFLYPAGGVSLSGAVNGITDDGYLYIVVHEKGVDIADAMVK